MIEIKSFYQSMVIKAWRECLTRRTRLRSTLYQLCSNVIREINKKTKLDIFSLPRINDILDSIPRGTERFSSVDVKDAFFCFEIYPDDRKKLAFRTRNRHLKFEVMVIRWVNSSSQYCGIIQHTRFGVSTYMDDVLNHQGGFAAHFAMNRPSMIACGPTNL